jgi:hypothetical protein
MLTRITQRTSFQGQSQAVAGAPAVATAPSPAVDQAVVSGTTTATSGAPTSAPAPVVPSPWPELQRAGLLMTAAVMPGPIGTHLSAQTRAGLLDVLTRLDADQAHFFERTDDDSDGARAYSKLTPEQALAHLEAQPSTFEKALYLSDGKQLPYPVHSLSDIAALDAIHFDSHAADSPDPPLTNALRHLRGNGFVAARDDSNSDTKPSHPLVVYKVVKDEDDRSNDVRLTQPQSGVELRWPKAGLVLAMDFFYGDGTDWGLSDPALAKGVRDLEKSGVAFKEEDRDDAFAVYKEFASGKNSKHKTLLVQRGSEEPVLLPRELLADAARAQDYITHTHELAQALVANGTQPSRELLYRLQQAKPGATQPEQLQAGARLAKLEAAEETTRLPDGWDRSPLYSATKDLADIEQLLGVNATAADVDMAVDELASMLTMVPRQEACKQFTALYATLRERGFDDADRTQMHEQYRHLLGVVKSPAAAAEALDLVQIPAAGETPRERLEVFDLIADRESQETLGRATADYRLVLAQRLPQESLLDAGARFAAILQGLAAGRNQQSAAKVFSAIQKGTARQAFGNLDANAATAKFLESYLLNKDVDLSLGHLAQPPAPSTGGSIQRTDDGGIQIGPVKIPRRQ